jgi:hypothetical protein
MTNRFAVWEETIAAAAALKHAGSPKLGYRTTNIDYATTIPRQT